MYEYKVMSAKNYNEAEEIMNLLAKEGWRVVNTTYWMNVKVYLVITFERVKK
ncbi:MAG: DUF4177 domain-containing protein [Acholeplasma sp.]|nr:DUF4177 domain-containing protein [Acholeplasma sp.]